MGFEQRFGIRAALARVLPHDGGIAGQLLVLAQAAHAEVDQRVEPEDALEQGRHQVGEGVAALDVNPFVGDHQRLFGGRLGVCIFHRHTQGVEGVERITEEFDPVLRAQQHEFEHQRLCWLSQCSR